MAFTRVNGIVLHNQVLGQEDGPALVFINSLGSDFRIWQEVVLAFTDRFRVVLYDKRGHGLSDAPPAPYSIDDHTDDLLALLDHLKVDRAAFVGLSVGGMIGQRIAVRAPERVQ
ncbi:MAG: alpha/beta fold hydrolase, partial [Microvirga sp.]